MRDTTIKKNFAYNLRNLRNTYGETQLNLANALDLSNSVISKYESGKGLLKLENLTKIAKHYMIPIDLLLQEDVPFIEIPEDDLYCKKALDALLPIISSEEALKNSDFKKAYELHLSLYENIFTDDEISSSEIDKCISLYNNAYKAGIIEGLANRLWWNILFSFCYSIVTPKLLDDAGSTIGNCSSKEIIREYFLPKFDKESLENILYENYEELEKEKNEFFAEIQVDIYVDICLLKHSDKYWKLGDFYTAVAYMFSLINRKTTRETNLIIGLEMISFFALTGNEYAKAIRQLSKTETE